MDISQFSNLYKFYTHYYTFLQSKQEQLDKLPKDMKTQDKSLFINNYEKSMFEDFIKQIKKSPS